MAQGIFSSLQFSACIRLMKATFFLNLKNPFACLYLSEPFSLKFPFHLATGCISVSEGSREGLLKNPCWDIMSLSIFQHVGEERNLVFEPAQWPYIPQRPGFACGTGQMQHTRIHHTMTSLQMPLWAVRPIFIFLIKARIHQCYFLISLSIK